MSDKRHLNLGPTVLTRRKRCRGVCRAEVAFAAFALAAGVSIGFTAWFYVVKSREDRQQWEMMHRIEAEQRLLLRIQEEIKRIAERRGGLLREIEPLGESP